MYEEAFPFNSVWESRAEHPRVAATASTIIPESTNAVATEPPITEPVTKNMEIMAISVGNFPLQGIKALVSMAISRSRSESIIRHPTTPAALHPNPIHMKRETAPLSLPASPAFSGV